MTALDRVTASIFSVSPSVWASVLLAACWCLHFTTSGISPPARHLGIPCFPEPVSFRRESCCSVRIQRCCALTLAGCCLDLTVTVVHSASFSQHHLGTQVLCRGHNSDWDPPVTAQKQPCSEGRDSSGLVEQGPGDERSYLRQTSREGQAKSMSARCFGRTKQAVSCIFGESLTQTVHTLALKNHP